MIKKSFKISGMHCVSCAMIIEGALEDRGAKARCSYAKEVVEVEYEPTKLSDAEIKKIVTAAGYTVVG